LSHAARPDRFHRGSVVELRGERNGPSAAECLPEPSKHYEVGVQPDAPDAAHAERREAVIVLQATELALPR
jgi:hypothetical protein